VTDYNSNGKKSPLQKLCLALFVEIILTDGIQKGRCNGDYTALNYSRFCC
jgi:hypothetical protein